ncbi:MAG: NAD(P)/FAD-dependent oxidoreductase, partial [Candidatus Tectomicrobia bacterium]|nr:NAD(P)/FAD-dependent oxidoreductase [Candidatus Tectomicrobia bacterium]
MTSPKPHQAHYVIVGNSAAGLNAVDAIRAGDPSSSLLLIADEDTVAYSRVATPYYISREIDDSVLFYKSEEYYRQRQVTTLFGHRVVALHTDRHQVELADGSQISYRKLLLATGSTPSRPPIKGLERVKVFPHWTLAQARNILEQTPLAENAAVLGGGFISLLTVNAMKALKPSIRFTVIERLPQVMPNLLDEQAARMLEQRMVAQGIQVKTGVEATELAELPGGKTRVILSDGTEQKVDMVVLGTGVRPNVDFLLDSGLKIQRGILVNERMETNLPAVYAAGDCAESFGL